MVAVALGGCMGGVDVETAVVGPTQFIHGGGVPSIFDEAFTMIIASDSQFNWWRGGGDASCTADECGPRSNDRQVAAMLAIGDLRWPDGAPVRNVRGAILNGDLTSAFHRDEQSRYETYYHDRLGEASKRHDGWHLYPGLGNHDYINYAGDCYGLTADSNECAKRALGYIRSEVPDLPGLVNFDMTPSMWNPLGQFSGSFAYSWDIGGIHFVQLHGRPNYAASFPIGGTGVGYEVEPSFEWLRRDLAESAASGRPAVINLHDAAEEFSLRDPEFLAAIRSQNVVAVFSGHLHEDYGLIEEIDVGGRSIPHIRSGSAECYSFVAVEFTATSMKYAVVDSSSGSPQLMPGGKVCDTRGTFNGIDYSRNRATAVSGSYSWPRFPTSAAYLIGQRDVNELTVRAIIGRVHPQAESVSQVWTADWRRGWNVLEPFCRAGDVFVISHKPDKWDSSIDRLEFDTEGNPVGMTGFLGYKEGRGWEKIVPFTHGGNVFLFKYAYGAVAIDRVEFNSRGEPTGTTTVHTDEWRISYDVLTPIYRGEELYFLRYDQGGDIAIDLVSFDTNGNPATFTEVWTDEWSSWWTNVVPVYHKDAIYLVSLKSSGPFAIDRLHIGFGGDPITLTGERRDEWSRGWDHIVPVYLGDDVVLYSMKSEYSRASLDRIEFDAQGSVQDLPNLWEPSVEDWILRWRDVASFSWPPRASAPGGC